MIITIVTRIMILSGMIKSREPYFVRHIPVRGSAKTLFETKVEMTKKAGTPHATI